MLSLNVFASRPKTEQIYIWNRSSKVLIITAEFVEYPLPPQLAENPVRFRPPWFPFISGFYFGIYMTHLWERECRVYPNRGIVLVDYYGPSLDVIDKIPFMEKMRGIFKSITISTEDGENVITNVLTSENLCERMMSTKSRDTYYGISYSLLIYDSDLE
jgi:hypothetical protein